ncbi:MAG: gliding motility-associated C-terminal domain-containing protein [Flavobacteriales bacterium]|nr:gliding motility-associated C-terminal domain-containing protein [Flavobacteriales bacterium]
MSLSLLLGTVLRAQPCAISIGNDTTICQGQFVTLSAPPGFPGYLWSTGSTNPSITVSAGGTYWGEAIYPSGQLFPNSDFSAGNTGFSSGFTASTTLTSDGNYWIGTNPNSYHGQFFGTGSGNFMIVNSGWPSALWNVYCQNVTVCPGQTYTMSYRVRTISNATPARLQWWIDGAPVGPEVTLPAFNAGWQTVTQTWTSGAGVTNANLCLRVMSGEGVGNDFGLDDITMQGTIRLRDSKQVTVTPLPVFDLGPSATLCNGQNLVLDAAVPGGSYVWQDGTTLPGYVVSGPGVYSVTVTANGCSATDGIIVNYNALPVVNLGPDLVLCDGETRVLSATTPGGSYVWQDGSTSPTFTVSGPGTYSVQVTVNNCSASDAVNVSYNPNPVVDLGPDIDACDGETVTLDATTPGATYLWSDGSSNATLDVTTDANPSVQVTVNGCPATDAVTVNFNPLPVVDLGTDQTVCPDVTVTLDATTPNATYVWQDGSTAATFDATTPGTYTVAVTVDDCTSSDSFTLSHFTLQTVDLGPDITLCQGQGTTIGTTVPGATYTWSTGATTETIGVSTAGIYWVDVTLNGCVVRDEVEVFVTPLPAFTLGPDRSICPGTTTLLDATVAGATYAWSTGASTPTITAGPGTYSVTVTANNCSRSDAITISAWPVDLVDLGADVTLCPGTPITLDATLAGATYQWQDGSTNATFAVSSGGTYSVIRTDANGCISNDAITVTYDAPTPIDLGADVVLCAGDDVVLDATVPGATYAWSTGASTPTITVNSTGNYAVVVTQGNCTVNDAIDVTVEALPTVDIGADATLCPGETLVLDATGPGLSYAWNTGATSPTITVSSNGTYSVTVTNAANCTATDVVTITYTTPGAIDLGADFALCAGESATLDATFPGATYAWSTGASSPTISVNSSGSYSVVVTQGTCTVNDAVDVVVNPMPSVELGNDVTLCAGEDITLDATWPGATYLWSTGATTPTITASTTGTYSVDVTLNGCVASDVIDVTVLSATSVNIGSDATICDGEVVTLDATTAGATYLWSTGATTPTIDVTTTGTYSVEVFSGLCSVTDQATITVNPIPSVELGNDVTLCAGENITLDATWPGATYLWSTGATTPTITASTTGTYSVDVTLNGCVALDVIDVTVLSATSVNIGSDATICDGEVVTLDATTAGATYLWSTGATTPTIDVTSTGIYSVEVFSGLCSVTDQATITVNPMPSVELGNDVTLCAGENITLDATWPGATYLWSTGATTPTITASTTGTYSVDVILNGCVASDVINVTVLSATSVNIGSDATICDGEVVTLDATTAGATYLWSTGATTPTIDVTTTGTYSVEVFSGLCSVTDQATITVNPTPSVDLGTDLTFCGGETSTTLDATWPGASYTWTTGAVSPTIDVSADGTYGVSVSLGDCSVSDEVTINFGSFSYSLGPDVTLCPGETLELGADLPTGVSTWNGTEATPTYTVTAAGTYTLHFETPSGCDVRDTITVNYADAGELELGDDITLCEGETVELNATVFGATHLWNDGITDPVRTITTPGTYAVQAFVGTCSVSDEVTVLYTPLPDLDLGPDRALCPGDATTFDITTPGASYAWNDGSAEPTFTADGAGTIAVTITVDGCSSSDEVLVEILDAPSIDLGNDTTLCEGATLTINVDQPNTSFIWDDGSTLPVRNITTAGIYWVDASRNTCTLRDSIVVDVFSPSSFDLGNDRTICAGTSTAIGSPVNGAAYVWSTGATTPTISVTTGGEYTANISVAGCTAQDIITVEVIDVVAPELGANRQACAGEVVTLSVQGSNVTWSTGEVGNSIAVTTTGFYTVTTDSLGCSATDQVFLNFTPVTTEVVLSGDPSICPGSVAVLLVEELSGATFQWNTGARGSTLSVFESGWYTVHATGTCIDAIDSIRVEAEDCNTYVHVPNSFTPNNDGLNDVFLPVIDGPLDSYQLEIFDRWGERIHSTNAREEGWDGAYSGVASQDGVYVWKLAFRVLAPEGVRSEARIGHVTLLR